MKRCKRCLMPFSYPGIVMDDEGVCSFCRNYRPIEYLGGEALKAKILESRNSRRNGEYDCAVGFSGGRDSSYLLHYLSAVLKLKVVAFTADNGFLPEQTHQNIRNIANQLNVPLKMKKYDYLEKCSKHHLEAWISKPSAAMVPALCVGCRLGMAKGAYELCKQHNVSAYITGGTPFEGKNFKTKLLQINPKWYSKASLGLGYLSEVLKNHQWYSNPYCLYVQYNEFMAYYGKSYRNKMIEEGTTFISPFLSYIKWDEKDVVNTITDELGWKKNAATISTWRGDCDIAILKNYIYKKILGYNDKDDALSDLIRDGQITRQEALDRLQDEQYISKATLKDIFKMIGMSFDQFENNLSQFSA